MTYKVTNGRIYPVDKKVENKRANPERANSAGADFRHLMEKALERKSELRISAHALKRLDQRNMDLSEKDIRNLESAVDKAEAKGSRESLLLYKEMAFVASIRNRTIITAVGQRDAKENVFTNIDSAVIIDED